MRDHVSIDDVAQLTVDLTLSNFEGVLNIASGKVKSFREVAILIKNLYTETKLMFLKHKELVKCLMEVIEVLI